MIRNYVLSKFVKTALDGEIQIDMRQIKEHQSYVIEHPEALIAYDIFAAIEHLIDTQYTQDSVYTLLQKDGKYRLRVPDDLNMNPLPVILLSVDTKKRKYYYEVRGREPIRQIYSVSEIDDKDVRYLVVDHIMNPEKGISLIERCYHSCFMDKHKADRYWKIKQDDYSVAHGLSNSGFRVFVVSAANIQKSKWYRDNLEIARQIKEYNLSAENYRYIANTVDIFMAIKADAYDFISIEDQIGINKNIYQLLRDYLPEDDIPFMDEDLESHDARVVESVADKAIFLALANAKDQMTFDKIHKILGHNEYRVGALTDDIYNANPETGFILVGKTGELQWYPECYAINDWDGAKGNPYYGKFQRNENNTLYSLREFHPELFVDSFPDEDEIKQWEKKYLDATVIVRMKHLEMKFDSDHEKEEIVIGNWYYSGLKSKDVINGISFHRIYGSHTFTQDECRKLLSGEELVVEKFITKMNMETTIRGKLKDCAGLYDDEMNVEFVRTDINISKERRMLNMDLGIEEPGLPPSEGDVDPGGI